ncbi:MAG: hypothetical protein LQ351_005638 [Letrouitia transgressa]|nr:MAG: hypothetical protein LQ351_005638 [Letrouitia transgressa]
MVSDVPPAANNYVKIRNDETSEGAYELEVISSMSEGSAGCDSLEWIEARSPLDEGEKTDFHASDTRSSQQDFELYTPDEERAVVKKFDRRLVLFIALLYMLSFLDRSNIGNARIAGMARDLHLDSSKYVWTLRSFYITYILFEWMTLCYTIFRPSIYIAACVFTWGLFASLQSLTNSFALLCVFRALLGISEAAFGPGVPVFLSFFYKRSELAWRTGVFVSAAPLATSFAGSLAWLITKISERSPISPWRMLFLIEGFPSIVVSVFAFHCIPDEPGKASYLTIREKKVAELRLRKEAQDSHRNGKAKRLDWKEIQETLKDPTSYLTAVMFFSCNVAFSSLPVFLPTIIEDMGYSALKAQALSAPPYLVAFLIVLLTAYYSDKYQSRSVFICLHSCIATSGYAIISIAGILKAGAAWRYAGVYLASSGFFSAITLLITWVINNQQSAAKKGTGVAMLNIVGQTGPLVGVHLFPKRQAPYYVQGMAICAIFMALVGLLSVFLRRIFLTKNGKMNAVYAKLEDEGCDSESVGSNTQAFRYMT